MADTTEERSAYSQLGEQWLLRGGGLDIITTEERDLSTEEMVLNIGPSTPPPTASCGSSSRWRAR